MTDFTSEIKTIPHSDSKVFTVLSDLSNLDKLRDRIPPDKLQNITFDKDTCSLSVAPVGSVEFKIVEREPNKLVKFMTTNSPVHLTMWVQLKPFGDETKLKMTVRADLNPLLKTMVSKPIQEAVNRISDVLATLPYDEV
jgi:carbon monoxide dehydrogenase subunit G